MNKARGIFLQGDSDPKEDKCVTNERGNRVFNNQESKSRDRGLVAAGPVNSCKDSC